MTQDEFQPVQTGRLIMEKMVMENFKSYAGRIEIGPFHKSFTSIVGANGSGKSNVIDALLFVFGFKAKKMRQEKLSGLVHHSKNHPDLEYCTVEIYFKEIIDNDEDEGDGYRVIEGSELIVSRRATKTNGSQYYINNKTSSYTEVTNLLKAKGIDLDHKRFLILQGEVESISQMKAKGANENDEGLLEYLEDIIGTTKYKEPLAKALAEMEALTELRTEKLNRIRIAEGDVKALESQKKEAEDYLKDENKLVKLKNEFYQYSIWESLEKLEKLRDETREVEEKLGEFDRQINEKKDETKKIQSEYDKMESEFQTVKQEAELSTKEYAKYERDQIQMEEKKKHLNQRKKKLQKSIEKERSGSSEEQIWLGDHRHDLEQKLKVEEKYRESMQSAEAELETIRMELRGKTETVQRELDQKKAELTPWLEKINDKRSLMELKRSELDLLRERANSEMNKDKEYEDLLQTCRNEIRQKSLERSEIETNLKKQDNELQIIQKKFSHLNKNETDLRQLCVDLTQKLTFAKSSQQQQSTMTEAIKALLQQKIPGVHGRLCDLGSIDDQYEHAISSACGDRLYWIVVDSVKTAEKCVSILKQNNAGRLSFIIQERLSPMSKMPKTPESAPRLIDLIKSDFMDAFYYVMRDTLVSQDLDQANRIAFGQKQRWKVVTLQGQVIDKSGTMSGGGSSFAHKQSKMRKQPAMIVEENLDELKMELEVKEKELKQCRKELEEGRMRFQDLQSAVPHLKQSLTKVDAELKQLFEQEKSLKDLLEREMENKKSSKGKKSTIKEEEVLISQLKQLESEEVEIKASTAKIQKEISDLQEKIMEIGGERLRRQNAKVKDLQEELSAVQDSIAHLQTKLRAHEKSHGKSAGNLKKFENELETVDQELKALLETMEAKQKSAKELKKRVSEAQDFSTDRQEKLLELKQELDASLNEIQHLRSGRIEVESASAGARKELQELQKRLNTWQSQLSKLSLRKISLESAEDEDQLETFTEFNTNKNDLISSIQVLEEQLEKAQPNLTVLEEYMKVYNEYMLKVRDLEEITKKRDEIKAEYEHLRTRRFDEFMEGFTTISLKLKEMYQMITLGGNAELELVDSLDPFSEGIAFSVMPPKKSWKNISNLSGGEKTLSSLALVFALHHYKPTPLYVMDEIDAALDFRNVSIIANYIKDCTRNAQFVIISLRNNMFELADRLVGIYKTDNCTKSVTIDPSQVLISVE